MISPLENIYRNCQNWNQREKKPEKAQQNKNRGTTTKVVTYARWDCQRERKEKKQKNNAENFLQIMSENKPHIQKVQRKQNRINDQKIMPGQISLKLQKIKYKENFCNISSMKNILSIEVHKHSYQAYKEHSLRHSVS